MENTQLKTLTPAQYAFIRWLSATHPNLMTMAEDHRSSLNGFMDSLKSVFDNITSKAPELLNQYITSKEQLAQLKLNIERARANQPPIETPLIYKVNAAANGVPGWVWGAGGAILLYLLTRK